MKEEEEREGGEGGPKARQTTSREEKEEKRKFCSVAQFTLRLFLSFSHFSFSVDATSTSAVVLTKQLKEQVAPVKEVSFKCDSVTKQLWKETQVICLFLSLSQEVCVRISLFFLLLATVLDSVRDSLGYCRRKKMLLILMPSFCVDLVLLSSFD